MNALLQRNTDLGLLLLRLSIGGLMLLHGVHKIFYGIGGIEQMVLSAGLPAFLAYGVLLGEVLAPIFIMVGYATRGASFVFLVNCLVAVLLAHRDVLFTLTPQGGWAVELLGLYLFGSLVLVFTGGGKYALSKKYIWD